MATIANVQAGQQSFLRPVENEPKMSSEDTKASRISHELINLRKSGFISADKKVELLAKGVSSEDLLSVEASRERLLGGMPGGAAEEAGKADLIAAIRANLENDYEEDLSEQEVDLLIKAFTKVVNSQGKEAQEAAIRSEAEAFKGNEKLMGAFKFSLQRAEGKYGFFSWLGGTLGGFLDSYFGL